MEAQLHEDSAEVRLTQRDEPVLRDFKPAWGPIGEYVFKRSYARDLEELGRKETWPETVVRVVDGNLGLVDPSHIEDDEREKLIEMLLHFDGLPAGRHLSASGVKDRQFLFNCHGSGWTASEPWAHFTFLFDELMQGGGVGANYSDRYIEKLPAFKRNVQLHVTCEKEHPDFHLYEKYLSLPEIDDVIAPDGSLIPDDIFYIALPDSREGWIESIEHAFKAAWGFTKYTKVVIDVTPLRKKGSKLKKGGGVSPGPEPLVIMLHRLSKILANCVGKKLDWSLAMRIDHYIADCVVAGGKRRSSRMSVKSWKDPSIFEFIDYKQKDGENWTTNISVEIDDDFIKAFEADDQQAHLILEAIVAGKRKNGEPGIWNRSLSMKGEREPEEMYCPNPCVTGDTRVPTEYGLVRIKDLASWGHGFKVAADARFGVGSLVTTTQEGAFKTGTKDILLLKTREGYQLRLTFDHRVMTTKGWVEAGQIQVGNTVHIGSTPEGVFGPKGSADLGALAGWLTGDGCLLKEENNTPRFYFYGDDRHLIENMVSAAERLTGKRPTISEYDANKRLHFESAALREHLGTLVENKFRIPEYIWQGTYECQQMYLSALFSADGSVQGTAEKGVSVRLSSSHVELLRDVQMLLLNFGIASKLYENRRPAGMRDLPDGKGGYQSYFCNADHELVVSKANLLPFEYHISFIHQDKRKKLNEALLNRPRGFYKETFTATVESITHAGIEDVYDVSVPGPNSFIANGIVVHNCGEIGLYMWENCNLGHINLQHYAGKPLWKAVEAFRLMARWLVRATYGDIPQPRQRAVTDRNRRIGVGFFGFHGWLVLNGIKYSDCWKNEYVQVALRKFRHAIDAEATKYSQELGIPRPVKTTTVAPTGSVALLPGVSSGLQPLFAARFKRRVRFADTDIELIELREKNYPVYKDDDARNTWIAEYWCEDPLVARVRARGYDPDELIEGQDEIAFTDYLEVQAMVQDIYANNAISFTINIPETKMPNNQEMVTALSKVLYRLKGTTVFPDKSRKNPPFERIDKDEWDNYTGPRETSQVPDECKSGCPAT